MLPKRREKGYKYKPIEQIDNLGQTDYKSECVLSAHCWRVGTLICFCGDEPHSSKGNLKNKTIHVKTCLLDIWRDHPLAHKIDRYIKRSHLTVSAMVLVSSFIVK